MKRKYSLLILFLFVLISCAGQTLIKPETDFKIKGQKRAFLTVVTSIKESENEIQQIEKILKEKLQNMNIFSRITEKINDADLNIKVEIDELVKVSKSERLLFGAMAGRARIAGKVSLIEVSSGNILGSFRVEALSSGGTVFAGTTEEVIGKFADEIVKYLVENTVN